MKKTIRELHLIENSQLNHNSYKLVLESDYKLPEIHPGQFANIEIKQSTDTFLRRPFSILDVDFNHKQISFLIKILGRASKALTTYKEGEKISVIFPLGNGFSRPNQADKILLIGGGSGVAPMLNLAKHCGLAKEQVHLLLGARSAADHIDSSVYQPYGTIHQVSEDGSLGEKGYVTNHSIYHNNLSSFDKIYTCGPEVMMRAIAKDAQEQGVFCEVSLENTMACGFGACLCCVEKTKKGNQCVCSEGPVFNINNLAW